MPKHLQDGMRLMFDSLETGQFAQKLCKSYRNQAMSFRCDCPAVPGMDENDVWLLPVGDSNYYFYLAFGHMYGARIAQNAEYVKVQNLVDRIIDSFVVEKLEAEK